MSLVILGIAVLCSFLFIVYTLVRYFEAISPMRQAVPELRTSTEAKRIRLAEYEQRIVDLKEEIPRDQIRLTRMESWKQQLVQQHERLQSLEIQRQRTEMRKISLRTGAQLDIRADTWNRGRRPGCEGLHDVLGLEAGEADPRLESG